MRRSEGAIREHLTRSYHSCTNDLLLQDVVLIGLAATKYGMKPSLTRGLSFSVRQRRFVLGLVPPYGPTGASGAAGEQFDAIPVRI